LASVTLKNVIVDFPIYGAEKSFRSVLRTAATGGLIRREGKDNQRITVRALDNISLTLNHGDKLGIVGHNGAGKTTLLRVCAGVYSPTQGLMSYEGKISALFESAPGLDVDDTGYENILNVGLFLGMTRNEIAKKRRDIEEFTELGDYLSLPVRTYSTGMATRIGFALATSINPDILVLDEGLGAGDASFAEKAQKRVDALIERSSILIFASHSEALIRSFCNRAILMQGGTIQMDGGVEEVLEMYAKTR